MSIFPRKNSHKVLFVAPEAAPFAKAGGLGEVMFALPRSLSDLGYDVRVMIPRYGSIDLEKFKLEMVYEGLEVPTDSVGDTQPGFLVCNVKKVVSDKAPRSPVTTYFLENMEYYEQRANIYGYADDVVRWALLCRGVLEFLRRSEWVPDVIVSADWQTGFLPNYHKTVYKDDRVLKNIATIFSIHNLFYQGNFDHRFVSEMDFDDGKSPIPSFFDPRLLKINGMKRGIMYSDLINTVSPTYAKEMMTSDYGELLDGLLRERRSQVYGVINGIDYEVFNPETNVSLAKKYSIDNLSDRAANKLELQDRFGLEKNERVFLATIVSRLTEQKGLDLLLPIVDHLIRELKMQLVVLGSGDSKYMGFFQDLEKRFPGLVAAHLNFDANLPHLFYAGADAILIPSRFEPSGLSQMEAMRYGCVPIVRKTGGLADTVEDYNAEKDTGTGFVFENFDSTALLIAVVRAFENYRNPKIWEKLRKRCMKKDFSWKKSAAEYGRLFNIAISFHDKKSE